MREKQSVGFASTPIGLRELLEATPDVVFSCDVEGRFQWLNSAIESVTGHSLVNLLGRPFTVLFAPEQRLGVARYYLRQQRRRLPVTERSWTLRSTAAADVPVSVRVRRLERLDGDIAFVGCLRAGALPGEAASEVENVVAMPTRLPVPASAPANPETVAQVADLELRVRESTAELDAIRLDSHLKTELLTTLGEEIRTPMSSILGMAHLLLESSMDADQRTLVESLKSSSQALITMVNDTLDFSMLQAGRCEIETIDFDLRVTVNEVTSLLAPFAQERGLRLDCLINHEVPSRLRGDPGRLRQVLSSLAGMAIRSSDDDGVRLSVDRQGEDDRHVVLTFTVSQTGRPMSDERRDALAHAYLSASLSLAGSRSALGLGISRKLVTLMGGEVGLETPSGAGVSFWFRLPLEKQPPAHRPEETGDVQLRGLKVLVVETTPGTRHSPLEMLAAWGCRADQVAEGREALDRLRQAAAEGDPYRVAIVDLQLPDLDGMDVGRQVRQDHGLDHTLLMMLASVGSRGDAARAQQAGFSAYLPKPAGWSELYDALVEVVRRGNMETVERPSTVVTRHSLADARRGRVRVLLVDDDVVNQLVAKSVLSRTGFHVDVANSGQEAIESCERQRYDVILMDIQMSELDGYTTATALRARERGHRTPIVAMTGSLGPEARDRCLQAGMDDYLPKPIDLANLCAMVEGWTLGAADWEPASKAEEEDGDGAQHDRPAIMAIVGAEPDTSPPVLDVARLEESCLGIAELRESLLHAFINDVRPRLERLSDSVRAGDGRRLQFEAHGLRGMCLTIGTSACARIFTELETMGRDGRLVEAKAMLLRAVGEVERAERTIGEHMRGLEQSKAA